VTDTVPHSGFTLSEIAGIAPVLYGLAGFDGELATANESVIVGVYIANNI